MASYAQIAQDSVTFEREDGSDRTWQFTFEKKDGTAQTYDVPIIENIEIKMGDRGDAENKPFKTHEVRFRMQGVDQPLMSEIRAAGQRDIRVTIVDTESGIEHFKGYVLKDFARIDLYNPVQYLPVVCYGGLSDLRLDGVIWSNDDTLEDFASKISTNIDIDRELDVFSSLRHDGMAASDPLPERLRFQEGNAIGTRNSVEAEDYNYLDVVKGVLSALGWQVFQRKGRLVFADLYDRATDAASLTKHQDDGAGGFNFTTENVQVSIDESKVRENGGGITELPSVRYFQYKRGLIRRSAHIFGDPSPITVAEENETEKYADRGLLLEGDVITSFDYAGDIENQIDAAGPVAVDLDILQLVLENMNDGSEKYYDEDNDEWSDTETSFNRSFQFSGGVGETDDYSIDPGSLPEIPSGGPWRVKAIFQCHVTATSDSNKIDLENDVSDIEMTVNYKTDDAELTRLYQAESSETEGETVISRVFLGDDEPLTDDQSFEWNDGSSWANSDTWVSPTGNGTLGDVIAARVGHVVAGEGDRYEIRIRDTQYVDMLTVFEINDNDGNAHTCIPLEIRHRLVSGWYIIRAREVFADAGTITDSYSDGVDEGIGSGTGTPGSTTTTTTSGITKSEADGRYFQTANDLSEGDAATILSNLGLTATASELNRLDGSLATVRSNLGLTDGSATLDLASLDIDGTEVIDSSRNASFVGGTFTGAISAVGADFTASVTIQSASPSLVINDTDTANINMNIFATGLQTVFRPNADGAADFKYNGTNWVLEGQVAVNTENMSGSETLRVAGDSQFDEDIYSDDFSITTDFSGTGWKGASEGNFNIRNLIVRESARFRELIIDQLATIAGSDLRSVARGKIASVNSGSDQITLDDPNATASTRFAVNDFFWVKAADIDNSSVIDLKGQITAISGATLTLDTTVAGGTHDGGTTDISSLSVGDVIVQRGHPSTASRQSLIYTTVSDSDSPVQKYLTNIDSLADFDTASNIAVAIGNLDNAPDLSDGTTPSGMGVYASDNAFIEGTVVGGGGNVVMSSAGLNLAFDTTSTAWVTWGDEGVGGTGSNPALVGFVNNDAFWINVIDDSHKITLAVGGASTLDIYDDYVSLRGADAVPSGNPVSGGAFLWVENPSLNVYQLKVRFSDGTTKIIEDNS